MQVDFIRKEEYYTRNGKQLLEVFFTHQLSRQVRLQKTLKGLYGAGMGWLVPDLGQLAWEESINSRMFGWMTEKR